jgi:hypothetical protein
MVSQYLNGVNNREENIHIYKERTEIGENYMTITTYSYSSPNINIKLRVTLQGMQHEWGK